jgi:hypothetical protein
VEIRETIRSGRSEGIEMTKEEVLYYLGFGKARYMDML